MCQIVDITILLKEKKILGGVTAAKNKMQFFLVGVQNCLLQEQIAS